jgi:RNA polymerase sigma factor (sigma-70 family)
VATISLIAERQVTLGASPAGDRAVTHSPGVSTLEAHLPILRPIIRQVCSRMRCFGADADDFEQTVYVAFIERKLVEKLEAATQRRAFLNVVVANLFRDFRIHRWGKWRPSAMASRLGDTAVALERLMHHSKLSPDQAVDALMTRQPGTASRTQLEALAARLPVRVGHLEVGEESLDRILEPSTSDRLVVESEKRERRRAVLATLHGALAELSAEDRSLLRLRFWDEVSVARLSAMTGIVQRSLYSRFDALRVDLRRKLLAAGIAEGDFQDLFAAWDGPLDQEDRLEP